MRAAKDVDYLIIGAGMAGTVLSRFLADKKTVLLDPSPGGYKIGESVIPEHYMHPELRALLPAARRLPSFSPKAGTTFVGEDAVASFPLPDFAAELAMHVERAELEKLMHEAWSTRIRRERVLSVDMPEKRVTTDKGSYKVARQILDCSGPAMVVAHQLQDVRELWPVSARWAYFDVEGIDDARFREQVRGAGKAYGRFDAYDGRIVRLADGETDGWRPSETTILRRVREGMWTWEIPLFHRTRLSFGVVSKGGAVSDEELFEIAERTHSAHYRLKRRPTGGKSPYDRVHARGRFAKKAGAAATMDYVLVADAYAFADPIYSVGTGLAVNKAVELAGMLNDGGWTEEKRERWCRDYDALLARAVKAFEFWYTGAVLKDDAAAREVQRDFLFGGAFQTGIATAYARSLADARADAGGSAGADELSSAVSRLLALEPSGELAGWRLGGAWAAAGGLEMRWLRRDLPELVVDVSFDGKLRPCYRRFGPVALSFRNLFDGPYPLGAGGVALFDSLQERMEGRLEDWRRFAAERLSKAKAGAGKGW